MSLSCLGLSFLGLCEYDPEKPQVYFNLGDVVAALSVTLLIPQFLKPIYMFRLRSRGFSVSMLYFMVLAGALSVLVAALLPSLPIWRSTLLAFPIVWEVVGASLFFSAYFALTYTSLRPARLPRKGVAEFVQRAAAFLSQADDRDRIDFARDISRLVGPLATMAVVPERDRKRTAFADFIYRRQLEDGNYASALLRIMSDPTFCKTLVDRSPWVAVEAINALSKHQAAAMGADRFVGELARQALLSPESMMGREIQYVGFSAAPLLSEALFANEFVVRSLHVYRGIRYSDCSAPDSELVRRIARASKLTLEATLKGSYEWNASNIFQVKEIYEWLFMAMATNKREGRLDYRLLMEAKFGVAELIKQCREHLASLSVEDRCTLYHTTNSALDAVAGIAYEGLASAANDFGGPNDVWWSLAFDIVDDVFPMFGTEPDGMDPLQYKVAQQILDKLKQNMEGRFPALTRVLLSVVGPHQQPGTSNARSAFNLLRDAAYAEWQQFSKFAARDPNSVPKFLPSHITYDAAADDLIYVYADGNSVRTNLGGLKVAALPSDVTQFSR